MAVPANDASASSSIVAACIDADIARSEFARIRSQTMAREVPGSSRVVLGGVIAYANSVKEQELGVSADDIAVHGAVSEPVAVQMARGVRGMTGATIGVGITGVAGPDGGTPEKPVGTVWIAVDVRGEVITNRSVYIGDRAEIRHRATQVAMDLIRKALLAASTP